MLQRATTLISRFDKLHPLRHALYKDIYQCLSEPIHKLKLILSCPKLLHEGRRHAGYELTYAKMEASWGEEHCPAYFVATKSDSKELLISIRGTSEMEDLLADITAFPMVLPLLTCPAFPYLPNGGSRLLGYTFMQQSSILIYLYACRQVCLACATQSTAFHPHIIQASGQNHQHILQNLTKDASIASALPASAYSENDTQNVSSACSVP